MCVLQVPHLGQRDALSIQFRKQKPGRNHSGHSCAATLTHGGSAGSAPLGSRSSVGGLPPLTGGSSGGSEAGGSEAGGSEAGGCEAGSEADGSSGGSSGGSEAGGAAVPPAASHPTSSGRALVVKNLPPSLPYEAVRVFFSQ